jgi:hypothetical protein
MKEGKKMKRLLIATLFASLLIGSVVTDAAATEIVILQCTPDFNQEAPPMLPIIVRACSKGGNTSISCPDFGTSCAQALANFLSVGGFKIVDTQPILDGVTYTLEKK